MLTAVAVILGLIAGGLLVALRRTAHRTRVQRQHLARQLHEAQTTVETSRRREAASLAALTDVQTRLVTLEAELEAARDQIVDLDDEIEAADQLANDQSAELASMAIENEELRKRLASTGLDLAAARRDLDRLHADTVVGGGGDTATLWHLELARSERTWRYSVAILPDDPSPFATTDDPLRLAIETEASALRDDVGAFLTVEVQPQLTTDPGKAHLVLRLAQELLAQAARLDEPSHLWVGRSDQGVLTLAMRPVEEGDVLHLDLSDLALTDCRSAEVAATVTPGGVHTITLLDV